MSEFAFQIEKQECNKLIKRLPKKLNMFSSDLLLYNQYLKNPEHQEFQQVI